MAYPAIETLFLLGTEQITSTKTLLDYWRWAHSNLIDNTERGVFAEFLVHTAMKATAPNRISWDKYDVLSPEGIKIEVKASGYIQAWPQQKLSSITFSIRPTYGWNADTNTYDEECVRQSDVYIFCLHKHTNQDTINILDTGQWTFFVLATAILNKEVHEQKTISLGVVKKLGAIETNYEMLRNTVLEVYRRNAAQL